MDKKENTALFRGKIELALSLELSTPHRATAANCAVLGGCPLARFEMKREPENSVVHLPRSGIKPPPTRLMQHSPSPRSSGAVLLAQKQVGFTAPQSSRREGVSISGRADLTDKSFSVTRARAHAQVRASAQAYAHARKDEGGLRRVLDAALSGGNVRVASVRPASFSAQFFAWLLIPAMLIAPLTPVYANDAPLADRVASDVAAIVANTSVATETPAPAPAPAPAAAPAPATTPDTVSIASQGSIASPASSDASATPAPPSALAPVAITPSANTASVGNASVDAAQPAATVAQSAATPPVVQDNSSESNTITTPPETTVTATASAPADTAAPAPKQNESTSSNSTEAPVENVQSASPAPASSGGGGGGGSAPVSTPPEVASSDGAGGAVSVGDATATPATSTADAEPFIQTNSPSGDVAQNIPVSVDASSSASSTINVDDSQQTDTIASSTEDGVLPILDVAPDAVTQNVDAIRAQLRNEMRGELRSEVADEVKSEVRREVEQEVYRGCKNLDGTGYYCIPDAKSFGSPVIANDRAISVVVQPDPITGNKQIFLVRGADTIQLTHGTDDNVFPALDASSDLLVWQSLQSGHWQIAYAHVNDVGVPKVKYLTSSENNFNPKVDAGRIVWQSWVDGNWEIFTAVPAPEKIPDDELPVENHATGIDGSWQVKRITANNVPDMFPGISGDIITWQAIDGGVWQVFAYDLKTDVAHRVSKPGVKSESPQVALVWNEVDSSGVMHKVGSNLDGTNSFDLTELARRLVDNTKQQPKTPVSNTEIVVVTPTVIKTESEASTTPVVN